MKSNRIPQKFNTYGLPFARKNREPTTIQKPVEDVTKLDLRELVLHGKYAIEKIEIIRDGIFSLKVDGRTKILKVKAGTLLKVFK